METVKIKIKKLTKDDLGSLVTLYRQFWNEISNLDKMKNKFEELKDNSNYIVLCASIDERVVGSITGIVCDELYGECRPFLVMENLVVDAQYQKAGIGKTLIQELENQGKKLNCTQIQFITEADRMDALSFYQSLGYHTDTHIGLKKKL